MKKVLLVAFHFPPIKASSGLERTLSLVRHLPAMGWEPLVLSAREGAYPEISNERMDSVPDATIVRRAWALDTARHLAIARRYPGWLARPDRWISWILGAVPAGLSMIRRYRPDVIWSTYPIATSHRVGRALHQLSGVPWVADYRDPMVEFDARQERWHPGDQRLRHQRLQIESQAAKRAAAMTFCTDSAREICINRYPDVDHSRWAVVPNGFDEDAFQRVSLSGQDTAGAPCDPNRPITLLHSGTIYPTPDRDPTHFLRALARVVKARGVGARPINVILRGSGVEHLYSSLLTELGLTNTVQFAPLVDYQAALQEMMQVDGLLLLQGYTSNPAIPAKVYEYFRAGRPLLALVDAHGETATLLRGEGLGTIAPLDDEDGAARGLMEFLTQLESGLAQGMHRARAAAFERTQAVRRFAEVFEACLTQDRIGTKLRNAGGIG